MRILRLTEAGTGQVERSDSRTIFDMATQADVRRIALSLPEATEDTKGFGFSVDGKGFAWAWMERVDPGKARVPSTEVVALRVANETEKQTLLAAFPDTLFTERHYDGYPAVLVRLASVDPGLLRDLVTDAWRTRAPRRLLADAPAGER